MSNRRLRRGALLFVPLALAAVTATAADGVSAPSSGHAAESGPLSELCEGTTEECAFDDARDLPQDIGSDVLAAVGPARYADLWIDRTVSPSMLRVGIVDASPADEALVDVISGQPDRVSTVDVDFSLAQLEQLADVVGPILDAHGLAYSLGVRRSANKVVAEVETIPPALTSGILAAGVPPQALELTPGYEPIELYHTTRTPYWPTDYEAGLRIWTDYAGTEAFGGCTTGFAAQTTDGQKWGLTAGHCDRPDEAGYIRMGGADPPGNAVGTTGRNTYHPIPADTSTDIHVDSLRFPIAAAYATGRILMEGNGHRRVSYPPFVHSSTTDTPVEGTSLCFQGASSSEHAGWGSYPNCGTVRDVRTTFTSRDSLNFNPARSVKIRHMWSFREVSRGGDSGGPVYQNMADGTARPAGILQGGNSTEGYTVFGHIYDVVAVQGDGMGIIYACTRNVNC